MSSRLLRPGTTAPSAPPVTPLLSNVAIWKASTEHTDIADALTKLRPERGSQVGDSARLRSARRINADRCRARVSECGHRGKQSLAERARSLVIPRHLTNNAVDRRV